MNTGLRVGGFTCSATIRSHIMRFVIKKFEPYQSLPSGVTAWSRRRSIQIGDKVLMFVNLRREEFFY